MIWVSLLLILIFHEECVATTVLVLVNNVFLFSVKTGLSLSNEKLGLVITSFQNCHYLGRGAHIGFSGCNVPVLLSLFFPPHVLRIVVEVKASWPPHVMKQLLV